MFDFRRFFHPYYMPICIPTMLSLVGVLFYHADRSALLEILHARWSVGYFLVSPFVHAGMLHFLLNVMLLHYVGGMMLLPVIGRRRFVILFAIAAIAGNVANNLFSEAPAVGMSAAVMGILATSLYRYGDAPMRLLLIHDLFRLPPFPLRYIVAFVVLLDVAGIIFRWNFIAHWAHLGGFAAGLLFGAYVFRRPPPFWPWTRRRKRTEITWQ